MDNNFDNTPEEPRQENSKPVYTDPNADVKEENVEPPQTVYEYTQENTADDGENAQNTYAGYRQGNPVQSGQSNSYQYQGADSGQTGDYQYQNSQYTGGQYQDNLNYNTGSNLGYQQNNYENMDTSPMSMGEWLLTVLAGMIPCAGIVLYLVWAFSKTGNVNRRNFCRAQLIVMGIIFVLYMIMIIILGILGVSTYMNM